MAPSAERPAPGRLELVQAFINTSDNLAAADALKTPGDLKRWLIGQGLIEPDVDIERGELATSVGVREALRLLLVASTEGSEPPRHAIALINQAAADAALVPRLDAVGRSTIIVEAVGVCGAIGTLVAIMHEEMASGRWARLKACLEESCRWAFYDASRNRSSRWCRMDLCGNRSKNRALYARQRNARN